MIEDKERWNRRYQEKLIWLHLLGHRNDRISVE